MPPERPLEIPMPERKQSMIWLISWITVSCVAVPIWALVCANLREAKNRQPVQEEFASNDNLRQTGMQQEPASLRP